MTSTTRFLLLAFLVPLGIAPAADAQVTREVIPAPPEESIDREGVRTLAGDDVPRFFLVNNFFIFADHRRQEPRSWSKFLEPLGIEPATEEATAIEEATAEAMDIITRPLPTGLPVAPQASALRSHEARNARDLGHLWAGLRANLARLDYDLAQLDRYLDQAIRADTKLVIVEETDEEAEREFADLQVLAEDFRRAAEGVDR